MLWALLIWVGLQTHEEVLAGGITALEAGRLQEAEGAFRKAAELAPGDPVPRILLAQVLVDTRRPKLALDALRSLSGPAASDGRVLCLRGRALIGLGEHEAAILELETAIDKLGDDRACREALGSAKLEMGDPEGALDVLSPLADAVPEAERSPALNATYGLALAQAGRHEEAVGPLRAAIAAQPKRARALFTLGRSLQALERFDEAAGVFASGTSFRPPENIRFSLGLARCHIRLGEIQAAREELDALVAAHPKVGRAWLLRGIVAFEEGRFEDSIRDVRRAMENGYRGAESELRLGMALGLSGAYDEAQEALDRALVEDAALATAYYYKGLFLFQEGESLAEEGRENPFGVHAVRLLERSAELVENPRTSLALAEAYVRLGQRQRAVEAASHAADVPELAARANHLMALAHHEELEYEPAEVSYRRAIEAGADSAEIYHDWGNLLAVMGRWDEAKTALEEALARDPDAARTLVQMGVVQMNLRDHAAALDSLKRAVAEAPNNAEAWYQKGVVESREGDAASAASSWQRALELDPEQPRLYYRLGAELVKLGRLEERNALLEEFQKRERETELASQRSEQLQNLLSGAVAASDAGEDDRTLALLDEARKLAPDDPLPYVYLGDFYLSRERFADAERALREGLTRLPDEVALYQTLLSVQQAASDLEGAERTRRRIRELVSGSP